uniref:N-acetyltransferase domain-containing protein n=1 Tax=Mucochytrium quahogii TaxID=96639 RepID=A0A7S2WJD5_9STRA|mmetsp:Transcript_15439/g.25226  ORF Transcript_15439/g.25226 Transcript_15439/m.25226 type:complete len:235 (+) Transcript_15439:193-897(+)
MLSKDTIGAGAFGLVVSAQIGYLLYLGRKHGKASRKARFEKELLREDGRLRDGEIVGFGATRVLRRDDDWECRVASEVANLAFVGEADFKRAGHLFRLDVEGRDLQRMSGMYSMSTILVFQVYETKEIAGVVRVDFDLDKRIGQFGMLSTREQDQGRGIGSALVRACEEYLVRLLGPDCVIRMPVLEIRPHLLKFYEKRGYKQYGAKPFPEFLMKPEFYGTQLLLYEKRPSSTC